MTAAEAVALAKALLAQATPGPWSIDYVFDNYAHISSEGWTCLASVVASRMDKEHREYRCAEAEANALLISKAPELIVALMMEVERLQELEHLRLPRAAEVGQ